MSTPKDKAAEIVRSVFNLQHKDDHAILILCSTIGIALHIVDQIENALTEYGSESMELQNMDSEFRFWEAVRNEINALNK